ncbi:HAD hydrolase-like protein [Paenibacillus ehimensis]|uniref:HAD hydrolase-like protein n=1 Tax=Paenibacillus ehimensis TaxID=79264 RepID=UPI000A5EF50B
MYPGIPQLLAELGAEGRKLIVATSKPLVFARQILAHFGLDRHFAHLAGFPPVSACLMIGDRKHDIEGARAHGMDSAAVAYGYGTVEELRLAEPAYTAATVYSLAELLRG